MPESYLSADELARAVLGLAGFVGALILPVLGAWLRLVLDWSRTDGLGLDRPRRLSGWTFARANALTVVLIVVVIGLMRAAGELRAVRVEAPVFVSILSGLAIGLAIWSAYALAFRALRRERALGLRGPSHRPPLRS